MKAASQLISIMRAHTPKVQIQKSSCSNLWLAPWFAVVFVRLRACRGHPAEEQWQYNLDRYWGCQAQIERAQYCW